MRMLGFSAFVRLSLLSCVVAAGGSKRTLITYNTGLYEEIGFSNLDPATIRPTREERRDAIILQLNKTCADAVCLQEVWFADDVYRISKDLQHLYRYSFSPVHDASGQVSLEGFDTEPPCPLATFGPFGACLGDQGCTSATTIEGIISCILTKCLAELLALPQECLTCFLTSAPDIAGIIQGCTDTNPSGPYRNMNLPGLLLLSRRPWKDLRYTDFHPGTREILEKGYLEAKIHETGQVVCSHTTDYDTGVYFELELQAAGINSWVEQGQIEINALVDAFKGIKRLFLLGDFNVDPGAPKGVTPVQPEFFANSVSM